MYTVQAISVKLNDVVLYHVILAWMMHRCPTNLIDDLIHVLPYHGTWHEKGLSQHSFLRVRRTSRVCLSVVSLRLGDTSMEDVRWENLAVNLGFIWYQSSCRLPGIPSCFSPASGASLHPFSMPYMALDQLAALAWNHGAGSLLLRYGSFLHCNSQEGQVSRLIYITKAQFFFTAVFFLFSMLKRLRCLPTGVSMKDSATSSNRELC